MIITLLPQSTGVVGFVVQCKIFRFQKKKSYAFLKVRVVSVKILDLVDSLKIKVKQILKKWGIRR